MRRMLMRRTARNYTTPPLLWSDSANWPGGIVPGSPGNVGVDVTIAVGTSWVYDMADASPGEITIAGTLTFAAGARTFQPENINILNGGALVSGSLSARSSGHVIRLRGDPISKADRFVANNPGPTATGGKLPSVFASTNAVAETITVTVNAGNTTMTVSGSVSGALGTATVGTLFNNRVRFTPTGTFSAGQVLTIPVVQRAFKADPLSRGLLVQPGGRLELWGAKPTQVSAMIDEHIAASSNSITMESVVDWAVGDEIALGPTFYYGVAGGVTQKLTIQGITTVSGRSVITTVETITAPRWGKMQHATDTGASLTAGSWTRPSGITVSEWAAIPTTIDERAMVANLSRGITIEGANDAAWNTDGFGAHMMWHGISAICRVDGVRFNRIGQRGIIGAYPIHAHMCSYAMPDGMTLPSDGTFTGVVNPANQYVRNCVVDGSSQRGIVIHGTHGLTVENNVLHDIRSHALFLEDGSEELNTITGNVILKVRQPANAADALLLHDHGSMNGGIQGGGSGIWFSNPNNTLAGNYVADCEGVGIWNAFSPRTTGLSQAVARLPRSLNMLLHTANQVQCTQGPVMATRSPAIDEVGNTDFIQYWPTTSNTDADQFGEAVKFKISAFQGSFGQGYTNIVSWATYGGANAGDGWTMADLVGQSFSGKTSEVQYLLTTFEGHLAIKETLNSVSSGANAYATLFPEDPRAFAATYHGTIGVTGCAAINFKAAGANPIYPAYMAGRGEINESLFRVNDFYVEPVEPAFARAREDRNKFVNFDIYASRPAQVDGNTLNARHFSFAHVIMDPSGVMTGRTNSYAILGTPMHLFGLSDTQEIPGSPTVANRYMSTLTKFGGVSQILSDLTPQYQAQYPLAPHTWTRRNPSGGAVIDTLTIPDGATSNQLGNFRHCGFNAVADARFEVDFGSYGIPSTYLWFWLLNANASGDRFRLRIPFSGTVTSATAAALEAPSGAEFTAGRAVNLTSVGSESALDSATVPSYYLDTAGDFIHIQWVGGVVGAYPWTSQGFPTDSNNVLWGRVSIKIN